MVQFMVDMGKKLILIMGVTAGGKATLSFELAKKLDAEIISIDSMKVYRRMDIGTAKPSLQRQQEIRYHMIDIVEPSESFGVNTFLELCDNAIQDITSRGKRVIISGGTAMYIKTLLYGLFDGPGSDIALRDEIKTRGEEQGWELLYDELKSIDPLACEKIHLNDQRRIVRALEVYKLTGKPISSFQTQFDAPAPDPRFTIVGLRREKEDASRRINARIKKMAQMGLVQEVKDLLNENKPLSQQAAAAIGYAEIIDHLKGKLTEDEAIEKIKVNTRKFAKAQRTWFKRFSGTNWLDTAQDDTVETMLEKTISIIKQKDTE